MSDEETKYKHSNRIKRKIADKKNMNDMKGAFSLKEDNPRKEKYSRVKLRPSDVLTEEDEY